MSGIELHGQPMWQTWKKWQRREEIKVLEARETGAVKENGAW